MSKKRASDGKTIGYLIFRTWRTNPKTGEREYAKDYGLRAFPIWIEEKREN